MNGPEFLGSRLVSDLMDAVLTGCCHHGVDLSDPCETCHGAYDDSLAGGFDYHDSDDGGRYDNCGPDGC